VEQDTITGVEMVVPCHDLGGTISWFVRELNFRLDVIFPADAPHTAVLSGSGVRLRLSTAATGDPGRLRVAVANGVERSLVAPNGTRVDVVADTNGSLDVPPLRPELVVTRLASSGEFGAGRAGMQYRDLIPGRLGGRFIASHIRIPDGGPVADYVHFHRIRFQMIYCRRGWVKVVYEDQGDPFVMHAGDCVLQPPEIRHRVLESSAGLEVIEIGCPAEHETRPDHELELPTRRVDPRRDFAGQQFVRHIAAEADWVPSPFEGFAMRDTEIAAATAGLAGARVHGSRAATRTGRLTHDGELRFAYVLAGRVLFTVDGERLDLGTDDSIVIPPAACYEFEASSPGAELLEVALPAALEAV
jgi:quercetin dioxygenase-like cupin family protein